METDSCRCIADISVPNWPKAAVISEVILLFQKLKFSPLDIYLSAMKNKNESFKQ